ncbi:conserved hypothetical protein [Prochlorococcus marinus str. MIT 9515]|uniref:Uncharacterized protein n=1 Tax=Prochlorococcus marinus (strain MIT 9515) TaxID=167542 RepID=A2BVR2_PROM5|nr:hypothetical protein [Prochlorococcus marinus]ABM71873.1 conserved hypothetical protein [Prochlorococcus marinus str. MIT 9515]
MSNSNYDNNFGQENYRSRGNNDRSNFRNRSGGNRDGGGFRIRLSDNEMKAVKSIQEAFQLKSTVAVLGFSVRTLSEIIEDKSLMESITKFAKNNKNTSSPSKAVASESESIKAAPNPFARPVKNQPIEKITPKTEELKGDGEGEEEEGDDK